MSLHPRDHRLIDALESHPPAQFQGSVWRVVKDGHDPLRCNRVGGRWDDGTFDVLYTDAEADGAVAEMAFHLSRGQPVFPSKLRFRLFEIKISQEGLLDLSSSEALTALGFNMRRFGRLSYNERECEYPRSQEIAEVAHFHGFTGLVVPSARWNCTNIILFCAAESATVPDDPIDRGPVDWNAWHARNGERMR